MTFTTEPFEVSRAGSAADALAAEILTMSHPLHSQTARKYWHIPIYRVPLSPDAQGAARCVRAIFEQVVFDHIHQGSPPLAPDTAPEGTSRARAQVVAAEPAIRYTSNAAIFFVQAPARLTISGDERLAYAALRQASAAGNVYGGAPANTPEGRVRAIADAPSPAGSPLTALARVAYFLREK